MELKPVNMGQCLFPKLSLDILLLFLSPHAHLFTFKKDHTFFLSLNLCTFCSFCLETPASLLSLIQPSERLGSLEDLISALTICPLLSADCPQTHQQFPESHSLKFCSGHRRVLHPSVREWLGVVRSGRITFSPFVRQFWNTFHTFVSMHETFSKDRFKFVIHFCLINYKHKLGHTD